MHAEPPRDPDPDLDDALAEAFRTNAVHRPPASVLAALETMAQSSLSVHLGSDGVEDAPIRVTEEAKALRDPSGRYQILGEVGRGGIGVVYKGRDQDLGRDVAMKVLRDEYAQRPEVLARFVEEAQIGGQLQHPGIVPVYELGLQAGERPYFAMKLVKGETLAAKIAMRRDPSADRRRFLGIFEQVCQTMAYAHTRHVVHRDLKPANVMIGAFGEVQVVDWGFAKVLSKGGTADERASLRNASVQSVIETVRSTPGSGTQSVVGSMLGTPAYMPPEQALGDIDNLDPRSDVFGLGAILCEILTGEPPYRQQDGDVVRQAAAAALDGAYERIRQCGADAAMVTLCLECLSRARQARPSSAQELADRVSEYLTSVEERAHQAELRATQARYKQRTTFLSMAAALAILVIGGVAWWQIEARARQQRDAAAARVALAAGEAREALARAAEAGLDPQKWQAARESAERLAALVGREDLADGVRNDTDRLVARIRSDDRSAAQTMKLRERDAGMLKRLVAARMPTDDDIRSPDFAAKETRRLDAAYQAAFAFYLGRPLSEVTTEQALASMRQGQLETELAAALDHLGLIRKRDDLTSRVRELAALLDPGDDWRSELRAALATPRESAEKLAELAARADFDRVTATHCLVLGQALKAVGKIEVGMDVLGRGREKHPQDFSLAFELATQRERQRAPDWGGVVSALDTARAIAPAQNEVLHRQGMALQQLGRHADAERIFRSLAARDESNAHWLAHVGGPLEAQGKTEEAAAVYRRAIATDPTYPGAHNSLGNLLRASGDLEGALQSFRNAVEADPKYAAAHIGIGSVLHDQGKFDAAIASVRKALAMGAGDATCLANLGVMLCSQGKLKEGAEAFNRALAIDPKDHVSLNGLGNVSMKQGKLDEAIRNFERAVAAKPRLPVLHLNLAVAYRHKGRTDEVLASLRRYAELAPNDARAQYELARELQSRGQLEEAIPIYQRLVEIDPRHPGGYNNLGAIYSKLDRRDEATAMCRKAVAARPDDPMANFNLAVTLEKSTWLEQAIESYRKTLALCSAREDAGSAGYASQAEAAIQELTAQLPGLNRALAIVRGELDAADPQEWIAAADLAARRNDHLGAARTYTRYFAAVPAATQDATLFYEAARSALLAAAGRGTGAAELTADDRVTLRKQAHAWLTRELSRWRVVEAAAGGRKAEALGALDRWHQEPAFAEVRGPASLASLPAAQAEGWRALWAEHAEISKQWRGPK